MTFLELKNSIRAELDEATAALYTDANVASWITAAENDIAAKTGCIEGVQAVTTTIGSRLVAFTGDKVNFVELNIAGSESVLINGDNQWIDTMDAVWQDTNTGVWYDSKTSVAVPYPSYSDLRVTPHHFGHIPLRDDITPQYWFQWGNYIVIEPLPTDTYALNLYVSSSPTNEFLTGSSNSRVPEIPIEFQDAIVPYVVSMGHIKNRRYRDGILKYSEYISLVQRLTDNFIRKRPARLVDIRLPDLNRIQKGRR